MCPRVKWKPLALPQHAVRPHPAAVAVDDPLYRREPDAGPGELALEVESLERPEEPVGVGHEEPTIL